MQVIKGDKFWIANTSFITLLINRYSSRVLRQFFFILKLLIYEFQNIMFHAR